MAGDQARVRDFARRYADAWGSHDPAAVASYYAPAGTIAINGGPPTPIVDAANGFISAFPDIQVHMDDLIFKDETVEFHWTFTGTNTGPGGSGKSVRISGFEEWTFGEDGLVSASDGHYDQAEYDRQLEQGASA
jgi:SnoaL-like domain